MDAHAKNADDGMGPAMGSMIKAVLDINLIPSLNK
jgi:hypothetical protein